MWASSEERNSYATALSSAKRQINELNMSLQGERLLYKNEIKRLAEWDDYDYYCYECGGYGDDYFTNDDGELECYCSRCPFNPARKDGSDS